jgi:hypothetical protein
MVQPEILDGLRKVADHNRVGADLGLREDDTQFHWSSPPHPLRVSSQPPQE